MLCDRLNEYRVMWIMVFFDLPVLTKKEMKAATAFRKMLLDDGFNMYQFSVYIRHCASMENAEMHIKRVEANIPPSGKVGILSITDKQFGDIRIFYGKSRGKHGDDDVTRGPIQLELF